MGLIVKIIIGSLAGFLGHKVFYRPSFNLGGPHTGEVAREATGAIIALPVFLLAFHDLREIQDVNRRVIAAWVLAFLPIGVGVVVARMQEND